MQRIERIYLISAVISNLACYKVRQSLIDINNTNKKIQIEQLKSFYLLSCLQYKTNNECRDIFIVSTTFKHMTKINL